MCNSLPAWRHAPPSAHERGDGNREDAIAAAIRLLDRALAGWD